MTGVDLDKGEKNSDLDIVLKPLVMLVIEQPGS
jgi:hypothetical protein